MPLEAVTVLTDGSGKTRKSVVMWQNQTTKEWESDIQAAVEGSHQIMELATLVRAFQLFSEPFNLVTDSAYVANIDKRVEGSI